MAAGRLPKPGTELGPCDWPCRHKDCVETRMMAASVCRFCSTPVGYERRFYKDDERAGYVHASCAEADADARQKGAHAAIPFSPSLLESLGVEG
jgi:hypothetical protein